MPSPDSPPLPRLDLPLARRPDREVAAAVLVGWDGRYLLQRRDDKPTIHMPDHWALFGGSLEPDELPAVGMARELEEELGFRARKLSFCNYMILK